MDEASLFFSSRRIRKKKKLNPLNQTPLTPPSQARPPASSPSCCLPSRHRPATRGRGPASSSSRLSRSTAARGGGFTRELSLPPRNSETPQRRPPPNPLPPPPLLPRSHRPSSRSGSLSPRKRPRAFGASSSCTPPSRKRGTATTTKEREKSHPLGRRKTGAAAAARAPSSPRRGAAPSARSSGPPCFASPGCEERPSSPRPRRRPAVRPPRSPPRPPGPGPRCRSR